MWGLGAVMIDPGVLNSRLGFYLLYEWHIVILNAQYRCLYSQLFVEPLRAWSKSQAQGRFAAGGTIKAR